MKLYVLDNNGKVVFDFSDTSGGCALSAITSNEQKVLVTVLLKAALTFIASQLKGTV